MMIYNLPEDLLTESQCNEDIIIRHYVTKKASNKNKIQLNRVMVNILLSGEKTVLTPELSVSVKKNQLVMLNSGNLMTSEVIPDNNPFSSIVIYIKNETLEKLLSNVEFPRKSNRPSPCQIFNQDDFIRHYARSLRLLLTSGPISSTVKWAKLLELFGYLETTQIEGLQSFFCSVHSRSRSEVALSQVIQSNMYSNLSLQELAFLCNMSLSTFKRTFISIFNQPPRKWLNHKKMTYAQKLICEHKVPLAEVYSQLGYSEYSSFSHAYKKHFGVSPREHIGMPPNS